MANLHIAYDDKFIDYVIHIARELQVSDDRFMILGQLPAKHVKHTDVEFIPHDTSNFWPSIGDSSRYKNVFLHYMGSEMAEVVLKAPAHLTIVWCFWGGEAFGLKVFREGMYAPLTKAYMRGLERSQQGLVWKNLLRPDRVVRQWYHQWKQRDHDPEPKIIEAMKKVDYFGHFIPEDYLIIKEKLGLKAKHITFHYASIQEMIKGSETSTSPHRRDIFLGNSDTPSNNHLDALELLSKADLSNRKVICPLSYFAGHYAQAISRKGKELIGENFIGMLNFLPKEKYTELFNNVAIAIMYHKRSQAAGNVAVCMWLGIKVYMHPESSFYKFLKSLNAPVFSFTTDFDPSDETSFLPLTAEQTIQARDAILQFFDYEQQKVKLQKLLTL